MSLKRIELCQMSLCMPRQQSTHRDQVITQAQESVFGMCRTEELLDTRELCEAMYVGEDKQFAVKTLG